MNLLTILLTAINAMGLVPTVYYPSSADGMAPSTIAHNCQWHSDYSADIVTCDKGNRQIDVFVYPVR